MERHVRRWAKVLLLTAAVSASTIAGAQAARAGAQKSKLRVSITRAPATTTDQASATVAFKVKGAKQAQCILDDGAATACVSPVALTGLASGAHTFIVQATDAQGHTAAAATQWQITTSSGPPTIAGGSAARPDFGVVFHCAWSDYTDAQRMAVLDKLSAAGVKWVRIDVAWSSLQETARLQLSQWYVDVVDRCVDMARAHGLQVLAMLSRTPAWANGGKGVQVPPLDNADFAWIAHWTADHFRGRVAAWEIWNEPDPTQASWSWSGTVDQYVQLLRAAYPAVKSGDPDALVVFGGPSSNDTSFVSAAYADGAQGSFDVMATHPYQAVANEPPDYVPTDGHNWWFSRLAALRNVMVQNGDGDKPIWFTEFGWSSHENWTGAANWQLGVTPDQQAQYLVQAIDYTRANFPYVTNMFWYDERNQTGVDVQNANLGLLNNDLSEKPAYLALQAYLTATH